MISELNFPIWQDGAIVTIEGARYRLTVETVASTNPRAPKHRGKLTLESRPDPKAHVIWPDLAELTHVTYPDRVETHDAEGLIQTIPLKNADDWAEQVAELAEKNRRKGRRLRITT